MYKVFFLYLIAIVFLFLTSCKAENKNSELINNTVRFTFKQNGRATYDQLKKQLLEYYFKELNLEPSFFSTATLENTDLIREMVHFTNYNNHVEGRYPTWIRQGELGYMFKGAGVGDKCGFMASTLYDLYKSLGYSVKRYDVINGSLKGSLKYKQSHVFIEVYITSLEKYVVQDPTRNNSFCSCESNQRLSLNELRKNANQNGLMPCILDNEISSKISPNGQLWLNDKSNFIGNYYKGSIISYKKFDGIEENEIKLHKLKKIAPKNKRVNNLKALKTKCDDCGLKEDLKLNNNKFKNFIICLNRSFFAQAIITTTFESEEKIFLIQYTNANGQNALYDPFNKFNINKSYFNYTYWDIKSKNSLLKKKYNMPVKYFDFSKKKILEF